MYSAKANMKRGEQLSIAVTFRGAGKSITKDGEASCHPKVNV